MPGRTPSRAVRAARSVSGVVEWFLRGGWRGGRRRLVASVAFVASSFALLLGTEAGAMGLGAATVSSSLGEPLRLSFPVSTRPDEEVGCVQVRPKGDDLPSVFNTRTAVVRNAFQTRVEVRSAQPVNEPAIGLVIQVGCTSPIAREYVLFLDPPAVAPIVAMDSSTVGSAGDSGRAIRPAPVRRATPYAPRPPRRAAATATAPVDAAPTRPARAASQPLASERARVPQAVPPIATATPTPSAATPAVPTRDRLTVVPTEPAASAPVAPPVSTQSSAGAPAAAVPTTVAPPVATPTAVDAETVARDQALRQQQAELQQQIKALGSQIAALQTQTTTLVSRNRVLEESTIAPWLLWLLIALAAMAVLIAGWMGWRYAQLRRSVDGAAWWTANTGQAPLEGASVLGADSRTGLVALDGGTRLAARPVTQTDTRASPPVTPQAPVVSNVDRSRPAARSARFPAAIDSDFTVSDIEAAMATVRTVSPPREAPRPKPIGDADFAPLGGPTMPSPFTAPPPAPPTPQGNEAARDRFVDTEAPSPARRGPAVPSPAPATASRPAPVPAAPPPRPPVVEEESEPLDFKLDIPTNYDPLATSTMSTTVVERDTHPGPIDFEVPASSSPLDFELPSAVGTSPTATDPFKDTSPMRHGATALADLFASGPGQGIDDILAKDEQDGAALATTGIDRALATTGIERAITTTGIERATSTDVTGLSSTAVDVPKDQQAASTRARMARFADMMNQVDEVATSDPLRAIAQLRQHVLRDENIPTLLWLRLFQLYQVVDKKPVYDALAEHFARRYHRPMLPWNQKLSDRVPQTPLSAMAQIDRQVEALWGKEEGLEKIRSLLCDRDQDDAVVFNAVLQRDLLDAAKVFPPSTDSMIFSPGPSAT